MSKKISACLLPLFLIVSTSWFSALLAGSDTADVAFANQILEDTRALKAATKEASIAKKQAKHLDQWLKHAEGDLEKGIKELGKDKKSKKDKAGKKFKHARKEMAKYARYLSEQVDKDKKDGKGKKGKKRGIDEAVAEPLRNFAASIQVRLDQLIRGDIGNSAPTADAGSDQPASPGASITLNGSASSDPDGDQLSFQWMIVSEPAGSDIVLDDATAATPSFTPIIAGVYVFELVISDAQLSSAADTVSINVSVANTRPVAIAGPDQSGDIDVTTTLDGSASNDPDGGLLSYHWAFVTVPDGSLVSLDAAIPAMPTFIPDLAGLYQVELTVNDGQLDSEVDRIRINVLTENTRPIANAGPDQGVFANDQVTLDGSASSDVDRDLLSLFWSFTRLPTGSLAELVNPQAVQPEFTADLTGQYVVQLVVNDGEDASDPDTVVINAATPNTIPVANAGADQSDFIGNLITLDGSNSSDADGAVLTFNWSLVSVPTSSTTSLDNNAIIGPSFVLDVPGNYIAQLVVNDGLSNSAPDETVVSTLNSRPVAEPGDVQTISIGDFFQLDGSASTDADGDPLTYLWSISSQPADSTASLSDTDIASPTFMADEIGVYVFQLIVNDSILSSVPATQTLQVEPHEALTISLDAPADLLLTNQPNIRFIGELNREASLTINGQPVILDLDLTFDHVETLVEGVNAFDLSAVDSDNEITSLTRTLTLDTGIPPIPDAVAISVGSPDANDLVTIEGGTGSVEPGSQVQIENLRTGEITTVTADDNGAFSVQVDGRPGDRYSVLSEDNAGNQSEAVNVDDGTLPDDPTDTAPDLNPTGSTSLADATAFLYTGLNPIQTGVSPATIQPGRAAVIRGKVTDRQGSPLAGVTVTVKDHLEYGQTLTRADGMFDLVVNGGGKLVISYTRDGYLPVQRSLNSRIQNYQWLDDIVMIQLDAAVTTVDLLSPDPVQVARASTQSDVDGSRTALLMFDQGTTASMTLPDGSIQPLTSLDVRATEYTVGENGLEAMPGPLPASSGYNYAVEFSVDEAVAAGAKTVTFSQPVKFYVENFTGYNIGAAIPVGYYDFDKAAWLGSKDGRIIQLTAINGDLADIDIDGDGLADDDTTLATLNIDTVERRQLATEYAPGQSLWRVEVSHFSPYDCNWPYSPPDDATPPEVTPTPAAPENNPENEDEECGCIIGASNQTLGEFEPVSGTDLNLHYQSKHSEGYVANRTLIIPVTPETVPPSLQSVQVDVFVEGTRTRIELDNTPDQTYEYIWDGLDAYGREVQGLVSAQIEIRYRYPLVRNGANTQSAQSWAALGDRQVELSGGRASVDFDVPAAFNFFIGPVKPGVQNAGLGGWTLSNHHAFDVTSGTVFLGTGDEIKTDSVSPVLKYLGGGGPLPFGFNNNEDRLPSELNFTSYSAPVASADGGFYMGSLGHILKFGRDNTLRKIAGNADATTYGVGITGLELGDGGDATQASFRIGGEDGIGIDAEGNIYFSSRTNGRIRKIDTNNIITTVAGDQSQLYVDSGDGGLAVDASLNFPRRLVVGSDGSVYFVDSIGRPLNGNTIRVIRPDGTIHRYAGGGRDSFGNDATQASIRSVLDMVIDSQDNLYFTESDSRKIRKITPTGIIETVAGGGSTAPFTGILATDASMSNSTKLAIDSLDRLHLATTFGRSAIYRLEKGRLVLVGGNVYDRDVDLDPPLADGGLALGNIGIIRGMTFLSDDSLMFNSEVFKLGLRRNWLYEMDQGYPTGYRDGIFNIAAKDGISVYQFDAQGRHLKTLNAVTGSTIDEFTYDSEGLLAAIEDAFGNVITVNRDADGTPLNINSADGQLTGLALGGDGYLASVANPLGDEIKMEYDPDGLLTRFTDKRDNLSTFAYDARGLLTRDDNPEGGSWDLVKTDLGDQKYQVSMTSAEGRTKTYVLDKPSEDIQAFIKIEADGSQYSNQRGLDGSFTETFADGTLTTTQFGPDPVHGMQRPVEMSRITSTPSGITRETTTDRDVLRTDDGDPFSVQSITETITTNGRARVKEFDAGNMTWQQTSSENRLATVQLNAQGRPVLTQINGLNGVNYSYDSRGLLESIAEGSGTEARVTKLTFYQVGSMAGFLESIEDAEQQVTRFEYDALGRVTKQILPDGSEIGYRYDANGNLATLTPPGRPAHVFNYNGVDREERYTPPAVSGATTPQTVYDYNRDKQLTMITRPDGQQIMLDHGATTGLLDSMSIPSGDYVYSYVPASAQLTGIIAPDGSALSYSFDGFLVKNMTLGGEVNGNVDRTYDSNFRIASRNVNGGNTVNFGYDGDDLLTQAGDLAIVRAPQKAGLIDSTTLGSLTTSRSYNGFAEMDSFDASYSGSNLYSATYTRDKLGRIDSRTETVLGVTTVTSYNYDPAGRLTSETRDGTTTSYTYDSNGNRTHINNVLVGTYDDQDRLLSYQAAGYAYTANGELLSKTESGAMTSYQYDVLGNLRQVTLPGSTGIEYVIDGQDRRVGKKIDGVLTQGFLYKDQLNPIAELDGNNQIVSRFVYGTRVNVPDYMVKSGVTYRIVSDNLGSPRLVINVVDGSIEQRMDYDSWGNVIVDTNPGFQPFGYAGGIYDQHTGLTRFGARDYDAASARWTSKDPIRFGGRDVNLYGYTLGDPVNFIDPTGLISAEAAAFIAIAEISHFALIAGAILVASTGVGYAIVSIADDIYGEEIGDAIDEHILPPSEIALPPEANPDPPGSGSTEPQSPDAAPQPPTTVPQHPATLPPRAADRHPPC
jgi:RHS repeat-associated protein